MTYAQTIEWTRKQVPAFREKAAQFEELRQLPTDTATGMAEAGLFRLLTPEYLGGLEATPAQFSEALQLVSMGDASAGWCTMIADTAALVAAYLPKVTAREVFSDPNVILAGIFAPMGKAVREGDTYRVSGRWQWASGSANCAWLSGGSLIVENAKPKMLPNGLPESRMMIFPREDIELVDTWHVTGLKGTGSGDMVASDAVVPVERSVSLLTDQPVVESPLYVFPVFGLLALGIASVALGNARASLDAIITLANGKKTPGGRKSMAERPVVQTEIAKAEASWRSAQAYLSGSIEEAWQAAQKAPVLTASLRADLRLASTHATRVCADICRTAYDLGGGSSVFLDNELQRRFRDAHTMTQHIMVGPAMYEQTGRVKLGLETDLSML
ncbi:acyl-CoA dehydrogenase family protein [Parvularcula sp. IMCC14364]|uniref:acyl-CoA dehydrogenase family protein n=1 Tax=Parvularcula sp. IMCC14364 TaxID=3067902 RepID=UPI00274279BB|nr:acyl-CoA dehydrogenase family protein [Parvularcula sp. IMCC14364]